MKALREIIFFGVSGVFGFLVDASILYLLSPFIGPVAARVISFSAAVITTWIINRNITFNESKSGMPVWSEFLSYLSIMIVGGVVNYFVYLLLLFCNSFVSKYPVAGVAAGSLAGMGVNFVNARLLLYRKTHELQK